MPPRSVTIKLRTGVSRATLPDNQTMKTGVNYTISFEDFLRISGPAKKSVIEVVALNTAATARNGTVVNNTNSVAVPTGFKLGQVLLGWERDAFKLVKTADADLAAGDVVTWADYNTVKVTKDRVGGTAISPHVFAGVALNTVTNGRHCWIQVDGHAISAKMTTDVAAGDAVGPHPTTDGTLVGSAQNEIQTVTVDATAGTFTVTYSAQTTSALAFDVTAAAFQTALEALSNIAVGDVTVTGGPGAAGGGTPYSIEFKGTLGNQDVAALTTNAASLTGGAATATVAEATKGSAGSTKVVGTALSAVAGGVAELLIRWPSSNLRSARHRDLYKI